LAEVERRHVLRVLEKAAGNRKETARILGIGTNTLWRKLRSYDRSRSSPR
jgi:two-component system response regulator HydG